MRKIIAALSFCVLLFMTGCRERASVGIIGGADGPTSIIVASSPGAGYLAATAFGVIVVVVIIAVIARNKKDK